MPTPPLDDEVLTEALEVFDGTRTAKLPKGDKTAAANKLGIARSTLSHRLKLAARRNLDGSASGGAVPAGYGIKGTSTLYNLETGEAVRQWVKTDRDQERKEELIQEIREGFEDIKGTAPRLPKPKKVDERHLSVYPIVDHHFGMLAWGREAGDDYDVEIARDLLQRSAKKLVAQTPPSERCLILQLGDYFHMNDSKNVTPASGHILDVDGRFRKTVRVGVHAMRDLIDLALQRHKEVVVKCIKGNHDPEASLTLEIGLEMSYENHDRVFIDTDPSDWWYFRYGKTLIGATHGDRTKPERMALHMAETCREDWGETDYHWFVYGHIHHESAKEIGSVRCESFQTLAAKDSWTAKGGYSSGRSLQSVTLCAEHGETGRARINIPPPLRRAAS